MRIRGTLEKDVSILKKINDEQGYRYDFPDLSTLVEKFAIVDEDDRPVISVGFESTADVYMFVDSSWETPGIRLDAIARIHSYMEQRLKQRGVVQAHAWIPPELELPFGRRLMRDFGWTKPLWTCFARRIR